MSIKLHPFRVDKIRDNSVFLFVGKRGAGKTTAMKAMAYFYRKVPFVTLHSETNSSNHDWDHNIPPTNIVDGFDSDKLKQTIHWVKVEASRHGKKPRNMILVILEDCMSKKKDVNRETALQDIMMNGRNHGIVLFIAVQYSVSIKREWRTNFDYVICTKDNDIGNRKRLYENFFGCFNTFQEFDSAFKAVTERHTCLVLDNTANDYEIERNVFFFRPPHPDNIPKFRVGCDQLWEYSKNFYVAAPLQHINYSKKMQFTEDDEKKRKKASRTTKITLSKK